MLIWFGNFIGSAAVGMIPLWSRPALCQAARNIVEIRMTNDIWLNFVLGILCGILMYAAVTHSEQIIFVILCVAAFILAGANHCVADMFYCWSSGVPAAFLTLIPTTIGNFVGCNFIPAIKKETS